MKLEKALKEKVMDTRLMDRLLAEGKLTKKEVDDHLAAIEDSEGSYEQVGSSSATAETTEQ